MVDPGMEGCRRHRNPDGTEGGWVSRDSKVEPTVFVARDATVMEHARVGGHARILDQAQVLGAIVQDNAVLKDRSCAANCRVKENAVLSGITTAFATLGGKYTPLTIGGDTHLHNVGVSAGDGYRYEFTGGRFATELPPDWHPIGFPPSLCIIGTAAPDGALRVEQILLLDRPKNAYTPIANGSALLKNIIAKVPRTNFASRLDASESDRPKDIRDR